MKTEFKVGDIIAAYVDIYRHRGRVSRVNQNDTLELEDVFRTFHFKQCRKLIKKKRREIWVVKFQSGLEIIHATESIARKDMVELNACIITRFVEKK